MAERIVMRTGEALVEGDKDYLCAEPEVVIGELDGPVGHALAQLIGDQVKGHTRVFAILNSDVQVRPATVMVSKVTVKDARYTGTPRQGQFLAFIHLYRKMHRQGPAEHEMATFFRATPPAVHGMVVKLAELGLITRERGVPRSARFEK